MIDKMVLVKDNKNLCLIVDKLRNEGNDYYACREFYQTEKGWRKQPTLTLIKPTDIISIVSEDGMIPNYLQ